MVHVFEKACQNFHQYFMLQNVFLFERYDSKGFEEKSTKESDGVVNTYSVLKIRSAILSRSCFVFTSENVMNKYRYLLKL